MNTVVYYCGTSTNFLNREVPFTQRVLYGEVSLFCVNKTGVYTNIEKLEEQVLQICYMHSCLFYICNNSFSKDTGNL